MRAAAWLGWTVILGGLAWAVTKFLPGEKDAFLSSIYAATLMALVWYAWVTSCRDTVDLDVPEDVSRRCLRGSQRSTKTLPRLFEATE